MSEDVIKLQDFQQRKLAVAHLVTGSKGEVVLLLTASKLSFYVLLSCCDAWPLIFSPHFTGNFIELFSQKLQKNELILRDELKLLFHLCQSADDMVIARDAIYR